MLLIAYGTRPEWLKVKPVIEELKLKKIYFETLFTGQHEDIVQKDATHKFNLSRHPDEVIGLSRLNFVLSQCIEHTSRLLNFTSNKITHVMVQGDTSSALGVALAAYNNGLKVIHLEAGLRTHDLDNPYPEEANRQLISRIASIHFCPTIHNESNLNSEQVGGLKYVVGNTALDNLHQYLRDCDYEDKILVTLHRRENHDKIKDWFNTINEIAGDYPDHKFILPIHPNPNVQKHSVLLTNVHVVNPLSHDNLINILVKCKFVITDSGGIQEECSFLSKRAIVCRKETERPEAVGHTTELCEKPEELKSMVSEMMEKYEVTTNHSCPFGDGHSAKKIVKILKQLM